MDIQRLRTLTTGLLHTKIDHVYEDIEIIIGDKGVMTHMLPRLMRAVTPWLREHVADTHFWDGEFDPAHTGELDLPVPTQQDRDLMWERYAAQPNPLAGKNVVGVVL